MIVCISSSQIGTRMFWERRSWPTKPVVEQQRRQQDTQQLHVLVPAPRSSAAPVQGRAPLSGRRSRPVSSLAFLLKCQLQIRECWLTIWDKEQWDVDAISRELDWTSQLLFHIFCAIWWKLWEPVKCNWSCGSQLTDTKIFLCHLISP